MLSSNVTPRGRAHHTHLRGARLRMYDVRVGQSTKARLNLTIDPDIYRDARRVFNALDMNMSGYVELSLALFLRAFEPLMPLLDDIEEGRADPAAVKSAMRAFNLSGTQLMADQMVQLAQVQQDIHNLTEGKEHTDKK